MRATQWRDALRLAFVVVLALLSICSANLMAVDLGTAYIKTAIARPGKGLELVTNEQSKRKTPAVVGFTEDGERLFGDAAVTYAAKKPNRVIFNARNLIGACAPGDEKPAPFCKPASVSIDGVGEFTGVHAVAMLLTMARKHAEDALGGTTVKDVAITVPASFHSVQRAAICDAATVAGLNCLGVINSNTAAAIKYALDGKARPPATDDDSKAKNSRAKRGKDAKTHTALFYDVGASGVSATVARFTSDSSSVSKIEVLAHSSEPSLGGSMLDDILIEQLADAFDKQREGTPAFAEDPRRARELPRVMARLRKEASRAREILSANTERLVSIGSLHQDMDLRATVTRSELEDAAAPLLANAARPALSALQAAGVRSEDLHAVVPFGGTTRMPKIQNLVLDALLRPSMNKSINSDEAAVMGAVFFGASLSSTFRVRKLDIFDRFPRTVSASITRDPGSGGLLSVAKKTGPQSVVLFEGDSMRMPSKKTVSFYRSGDFDIKVYFDLDKTGQSPFSERTLYADIKVTGVAKVLDRLGKNPGSKKGGTKPTPRVALTFHLDHSGNIRIGTAESSVDEKIIVEREVPTKTEKKESASATPSSGATESPSASASDAKESSSPSADAKKEEKKTRIEKREQSIVHRQSLKIEYLATEGSIYGFKMSSKELAAAKSVLKKLEEADNDRLERADALNGLEGYILSARSKLRSVEEGDDLYEVSTEEERQELMNQLNEAEDWMFTDEASQTASLRKKHHELRKAIDALEGRAKERAERPKAVEQFRKDIDMAIEQMAVVEKLHIERKSGNEKAFEGFREAVANARKWLDEQVAAQEKLAATVESTLTVKMIDEKWEEVLGEVTKIAKLELPPAPSQAPSESPASSETNTGSDETPSGNDKANATEEGEGLSEDVKTKPDDPSVEKEGMEANVGESGVKDEL